MNDQEHIDLALQPVATVTLLRARLFYRSIALVAAISLLAWLTARFLYR